jgi:pimeloyl-ACP methyl ester carboxylesterase
MVSGLGADARLFEPQRALPWPITVVRWLEPYRRETLASYGERLAECVSVTELYFLGGISMGGMVALEMSRRLRPEAVFLIASARSARAIHPFYRMAAGAISLIPVSLSRLAKGLAKRISPAARELNQDQQRLCWEMANDTPPRFIRWALRAVASWPGVDLPGAPVYHIHGDRDRIMPIHRVKADHVVRGGGHMINMTHADEVNGYLTEKIRMKAEG